MKLQKVFLLVLLSLGNISQVYAKKHHILGCSGQTGDFVVKPDHFDITGAGIPGTTSATGTVFTQSGVKIMAGKPFAATITARSATGAVTPNFGSESPGERVKLVSMSVALPTGAGACGGSPCNGSQNNGTITSVSTQTVNNGVITGTFSFDEVGSFNVAAASSDGNYLGGGDVPNKPTVVIGRFIPDHFDIVADSPAPSFNAANTAGTTPFTYLEQPFVYNTQPKFTATAMSFAGTVTKNYSGALWKLTLLPSSQQYVAATGSPTINSTSATATTPVCASTGYGVGTCTFSSGSGLKFMKTTGYPLTHIAPFQAAIQLKVTVADTDTVPSAVNPFTFGTINPGTGIAFNNNGNTFYHGRLFVQNTQGSEMSTLAVPVFTQYYNGTGFVTNTNDNSTNLGSVSNLTLTQKELGSSKSFATTATLPSPTVFNQGAGTINLSQPSPNGATGYVDIQVNLGATKANLPWLQYNWPYAGPMDGSYTDDPVGRAIFGTMNSNAPYIYQQEKY